MSLEATKRIMNDYLQALLNGGDFGQYFTPDVLWTTVETGDTISGREAVREFIVALHTQLFEAQPEVVRVAIDDGVAALEAVFVGTHIAEFAGVEPMSASVRLPYTVFYDVTDEGISELRAYISVRALIEQIQKPVADSAAAV